MLIMYSAAARASLSRTAAFFKTESSAQKFQSCIIPVERRSPRPAAERIDSRHFRILY